MSSKNPMLKIGCDPEVFVKVDGKFINPLGLTKGTKEKPEKCDGGAMQIDGMALEFNINPATNYEEFRTNIEKVRDQLIRKVGKRYGDKGQLWSVPVAEFDSSYLAEQPKESIELGCNADWNAYTGEINPKPDASKPFRTGAGHIHIGWGEGFDVNDPDHIEACQMMTKQLDCSLGILFALFEKDTRRRSLYGDFGAYRPKTYGVEYRTISNIWLRTDSMWQIVYSAVERSFNDLMNGVCYYDNTMFQQVMNDIRSNDIWDKKVRDIIIKNYSKACSQSGVVCNVDYLTHIYNNIESSKKSA